MGVMYFKSRADAGRQLTHQLKSYRTKNCVVLAVNPGGVLVGAQIAIALHADLFMLASERVMLPGEPVAFGAVSSDSTFTRNSRLSEGEQEELRAEFYGVIEAERAAKMQKLHRVLGASGEVPRDMLRRRVVILVSDGFTDSFDLDIAADFLKPINIEKLVIVCPVAGVNSVDAMHLKGDEIHCLYVAENLFDTDHYYEDNTIPGADSLRKIMQHTPLNWQLHE